MFRATESVTSSLALTRCGFDDIQFWCYRWYQKWWSRLDIAVCRRMHFHSILYPELVSIFNSNNNYNEYLLELQVTKTGDIKDLKSNGTFLAFVLYPILIEPVLFIWCANLHWRTNNTSPPVTVVFKWYWSVVISAVTKTEIRALQRSFIVTSDSLIAKMKTAAEEVKKGIEGMCRLSYMLSKVDADIQPFNK